MMLADASRLLMGSLLGNGWLFALATRRPGNFKLLVASWAVKFFGERVLSIVPLMSCLGNKVSLWGVVVEIGIDSSIDSRPRHASGPQIFQSESETIFQIISRVQHEGVPYHKNI
jgi:hypothetical protein